MGHVTSTNGIEVDKTKVEVISKLLSPKTVREGHSFLGHASFIKTLLSYLGHFSTF